MLPNLSGLRLGPVAARRRSCVPIGDAWDASIGPFPADAARDDWTWEEREWFEQARCAFCYSELSDDANGPPLVLCANRHVYHRACAQSLVDRGTANCPECATPITATGLARPRPRATQGQLRTLAPHPVYPTESPDGRALPANAVWTLDDNYDPDADPSEFVRHNAPYEYGGHKRWEVRVDGALRLWLLSHHDMYVELPWHDQGMPGWPVDHTIEVWFEGPMNHERRVRHYMYDGRPAPDLVHTIDETTEHLSGPVEANGELGWTVDAFRKVRTVTFMNWMHSTPSSPFNFTSFGLSFPHSSSAAELSIIAGQASKTLICEGLTAV